MKALLLEFGKYNQWANNRLIDVLIKLDDTIWEKEIVSSFPGLKKTILHIWSAENIWLQRLLLTENPVWVQDVFTGGNNELVTHWQKTSTDLTLFIEKQHNENAFTHILEFYDRSKKQHKTEVYKVLQHTFNHSNFHRGQLITMLRQLQITKLPSTDFIIYAGLFK